MNILSVDQFTKTDVEAIFESAQRMKNLGNTNLLQGKILTCLFYEPSTRTSSSFIAAMERLGGSVIPITQGVQYSSVSKGETLEDTIRTLAQYSDAIVLRHPEMGAVARAAEVSSVPIINAGDGVGEHPTQALLDLFTIYDEIGYIDNLVVALIGDLKNGRTIHSLAKILNLYNVNMVLGIAPKILRIPKEVKRRLLYDYIPLEILDKEAISLSDVFYVTRVQKERFDSLNEYEKVKNCYKITPQLMQSAKQSAIVMHPLPRVGEIDSSFDSDPRAAYFRQVQNGMWIRMALLAKVLNE